MIVEIPVFFSDKTMNMRVEVQIRTIAMDFWASLEHDLKYKKNDIWSEDISSELLSCAEVINDTDNRMMAIRDRIYEFRRNSESTMKRKNRERNRRHAAVRAVTASPQKGRSFLLPYVLMYRTETIRILFTPVSTFTRSGYYAAADHDVAVVKNDRLSAGYRSLRLVKGYFNTSVVGKINGAGRFGLAVAHLLPLYRAPAVRLSTDKRFNSPAVSVRENSSSSCPNTTVLLSGSTFTTYIGSPNEMPSPLR